THKISARVGDGAFQHDVRWTGDSRDVSHGDGLHGIGAVPVLITRGPGASDYFIAAATVADGIAVGLQDRAAAILRGGYASPVGGGISRTVEDQVRRDAEHRRGRISDRDLLDTSALVAAIVHSGPSAVNHTDDCARRDRRLRRQRSEWRLLLRW